MKGPTKRPAALVATVAMLGLLGCGGAPVRELAEHHVWERAVCEVRTDADEALVRDGINADLTLVLSLMPVPERSIVALDPQGRANPLADRVLVRERVRSNRIPLAETRVEVELLVNGTPAAEAPLTLDELARRTSETLPRPRRVVVRARHVGPGETLARIGAGMVTLGVSELLIRAVERPPGIYMDAPTASEIAASAPRASAVWVATQELAERDRLHVWRRPAEGSELALDVRITYVGRDRNQRPCELQERLQIPLGRGPLASRIEARLGAREYTLAELRALSAGADHRE